MVHPLLGSGNLESTGFALDRPIPYAHQIQQLQHAQPLLGPNVPWSAWRASADLQIPSPPAHAQVHGAFALHSGRTVPERSSQGPQSGLLTRILEYALTDTDRQFRADWFDGA